MQNNKNELVRNPMANDNNKATEKIRLRNDLVVFQWNLLNEKENEY